MELISYANLAVELVNTGGSAGPDTDGEADAPALRHLLAGPDLQETATDEDLAVLRTVREQLREVFDTAHDGTTRRTMQVLNALLTEHPVHPQVSGHDDSDLHLHLTDCGGSAERYVAGAVMGLAVLVTTLGVDRLGVCEASRCRDVFVDTSRNSSRRYCNDRCATRANVAAYRARKRARSA
ncbi:MAG: CGNR zinc finger domain-containing protein [Actinomycetes bacterium]